MVAARAEREDEAVAEAGRVRVGRGEGGGGQRLELETAPLVSGGDVATWGDARGRAAEGRTTERGRTRGGERTHRSGKCLLCSF